MSETLLNSTSSSQTGKSLISRSAFDRNEKLAPKGDSDQHEALGCIFKRFCTSVLVALPRLSKTLMNTPNNIKRTLLFLLLLLSWSTTCSQAEEIHALLVGVTKYPALSNAQQLDGPINDVKHAQKTLLQRFGSEQNGLANRIVALHEEQSKEYKPTYANIEREFAALAERVTEGDQVFILLSGHGSQALDDAEEGSDDYEPDGLDEMFLPSDIKGWNEEKKTVEGGIRDDQINDWLNAIQAKGATVVFVSDSCHSNTQTRGGTEDDSFKSRRVDLVPPHILEQRVTRRSRGNSSEKSPLEGAPKASRIGFFAAQTDETTPDSFRLPGEEGRTKLGLLTFTFCQVINESQGPITYRELGQLIHKKYQYYRNETIGPAVPTPAMSGLDLDRVFLGNQWQVGRSRLNFETFDDLLEISGGSIDGLTTNTVLRLYPVAGSSNANEVLGFARIDEVNLRTSFATFVVFDENDKRFKTADQPKSIKEGRCEIHEKSYGTINQITVELDNSFDSQQDTRDQIIELGKKDSSPFVVSDKDAEFVMSIEGEGADSRIVLSRVDKQLATVASFDLGPIDKNSVQRIEAAFKRIWRTKSLTDLAARMAPFKAEDSQYGGNVSVEVVATMKVKDSQGVLVEVPLDLAGGDSLPVGAQVSFRVNNYSASQVNVTLLYVDDSYRIIPLLPGSGIESNTIAAAENGAPKSSPEIGPFPVETYSRMAESIIVIATRADETMSAKSDYTYLTQKPLNKLWSATESRQPSRSRAPVSTTAWDQTTSKYRSTNGTESPLEKLFQDSGFNSSKSRSFGGALVRDHSVGIMTWNSARPQIELENGSNELESKLENQFFQSDTRPWPTTPRASQFKSRGAGESVYPKAAPAIVVIRTESAHGTGFVISEDGWILTNHHVVEDASFDPKTGARVAKVHFGLLKEGWMNLIAEPVEAEIYKWDKDKDLALLKLREVPEAIENLTTIPIAETTSSPGADCIAIGHPSSGGLWTLRTGDVAGVATWPGERIDFIMERMHVRASNRNEMEEFLSTAPQQKVLFSTCGLNPGDSGGPLLNTEGEVIAVNFAVPTDIRDDKFSFHVHLSEVKDFIADKPEKALIEKPEVPDDWESFEIEDFDNNGSKDTVILESESGYGFLVDLDADSNFKSVSKAKTIEEITENLDPEFAVYLQNGVECFYDTDADGEFDLRLIDSDLDATADSVWVRQNGDWTIQQSVKMKMFDVEHFQSNRKQFAKPFDKTTQAIIEFLRR